MRAALAPCRGRCPPWRRSPTRTCGRRLSRYGISSALTTKPARSCESMHCLPSVPSANWCARVDGLLGGHDRAHDLDEREHRHRVEEVHAEHAVGLRGVGAELHDRHRRGVGGEELGVGQELVEPEEQLALGLLVLDHGLDRGVGALEVLDAGGVGEALAGGGAVVLGRACRSGRRGRATCSIFARVCSARASSTSTTVTSTPERAQTSAIPEPMRPPPITPTRMAAGTRLVAVCALPSAADAAGASGFGGGRGRRRRSRAGSSSRGASRGPRRARRPPAGRACSASPRSSTCCASGRLRALRVDVDDVVHVSVSSYLLSHPCTANEQPRRYRLRGKSGHHRAGWSVTPTRGNPRESATENTPPTLRDSQLQSRAGKVEMVR